MAKKASSIFFYTEDLSIFELHEHNRNLHSLNEIIASMRERGFMPSRAIQVIPSSPGKFKIVSGHHRFASAKQLGIGVWYAVDDSSTDIVETTRQDWTIEDRVVMRSKNNEKDYVALLDFSKKHKINIGASASLLFGQSAMSHNVQAMIKKGSFSIRDAEYANKVAEITDYMREIGIKNATSSPMVNAISSVLRVEEFNPEQFKSKAKRVGHEFITGSPTREGCLEQIERVYNYQSKDKIPLKFLTENVMRKRNVTFGRMSK